MAIRIILAIPSVLPPAAPAIVLTLASGLDAGVITTIGVGGDGNGVSTAILARWARVKGLLSTLVDKLVN